MELIIILVLTLIIVVLIKQRDKSNQDLANLKQELYLSVKSDNDVLNNTFNVSFGNLNARLNELTQNTSLQNESLIRNIDDIRKQNDDKLDKIRETVDNKVSELQKQNNLQISDMKDIVKLDMISSIDNLKSEMKNIGTTLDKNLNSMSDKNEKKLDEMRGIIDSKITSLQEDNHRQLDKMRETVDDKMQKTLENRISQSFQIVNERLEQVYKGLGEMQTLATNVGDLKKVMSNVKTRGILGEYQLKAILEEILNPEQYEENIITKLGTLNRVEFAVKLPGKEGKPVYMPIDSKFPGDTYAKVVDAYETGNQDQINKALKDLDAVIKKEAKDIHDKYIDVPNTTDFGIMFLPFEGLYSEVVRRGMVEVLQREYKVNIAGPTTMAALLNSLQMGFKTLAIQKRSSEVWQVLGEVKTEFEKFEETLIDTQKRMDKAQEELKKLIGTRTRAINRKLQDVSILNLEEKIEQRLDNV